MTENETVGWYHQLNGHKFEETAGNSDGQGMTEDEIVEWHHQLNEHEFEQTLGNDEGQGSLMCCSL